MVLVVGQGIGDLIGKLVVKSSGSIEFVVRLNHCRFLFFKISRAELRVWQNDLMGLRCF